MPVPRQRSYLVQDAVGTKTYRKPIKHAPGERRCERCHCLLAHDQRAEWCSPCQTVDNGTPWIISSFLSDRPDR